jgi:hypothetical protein
LRRHQRAACALWTDPIQRATASIRHGVRRGRSPSGPGGSVLVTDELAARNELDPRGLRGLPLRTRCARAGLERFTQRPLRDASASQLYIRNSTGR